MPNPCRLAHLDSAQLARSRLRIAWDMLTQVAERLDLLPPTAQAPLAQALAQLAVAKAAVEETTTATAKEHTDDRQATA